MKFKWKNKLQKIIPGIITGGADNDPAGISTYSVSGAQFGYQQLWIMILATPMLIAVQAMCARLGDVKRKGLMLIIKEHFHPGLVWVSVIVLIICNTATLSADLAAIVDSMSLVTGINYMVFILPVALILWLIIVYRNFKVIEKYLLIVSLVFVSYIASGILAKPDWMEIFKSLILPSFPLNPQYFIAALGLMGTTITPSLFFWQSKQDIEEHHTPTELVVLSKNEDKNVAPGFIFSNIISLFIMISTAAVLHKNNINDINTAQDAARALEPFAGPMAKWLFAIGIIGSGFIAVPVFATSSAYAISELFGWRETLSAKLQKAKGFYAIITISIIIGVLFSFSGISPIKSLLYSQVLNGILAPFLIVLILLLSTNKKIMGASVNRKFDTFFGWFTVLVMVGSTVGLIITLLK